VDLARLSSVFALGAVELWAAIPAGLALDVSPVLVGVVAAAGAMLGVVVVVLLGERVRDRVVRRHGDGGQKGPQGLIRRIWDRYGVIGLGLVAPLLTGAPVAAALGLALGVPARRLLFWMSIGIALWSTVLTLVGVLGIAGLEAA
jgi:hypothetical protein